MSRFLSDLGAALSWIWMTPEAARRVLRQRDVAAELDGAPGAYAAAA